MSNFECAFCGLPFTSRVDAQGTEVQPAPQVWRYGQAFCSEVCAQDERVGRVLDRSRPPRSEEDREKLVDALSDTA